MRAVHVKAAVIASVVGLAGCGAAPSEVSRAPVTLGAAEKPDSAGEGHGAEVVPVQFFGDGGVLGPPPNLPTPVPDAGVTPGPDPFQLDAGAPPPSPTPFGRDGGLFL